MLRTADDKQCCAAAVLSMIMGRCSVGTVVAIGLLSLWQIFEAWDQNCGFDVLFAVVPAQAGAGTSSNL